MTLSVWSSASNKRNALVLHWVNPGEEKKRCYWAFRLKAIPVHIHMNLLNSGGGFRNCFSISFLFRYHSLALLDTCTQTNTTTTTSHHQLNYASRFAHIQNFQMVKFNCRSSFSQHLTTHFCFTGWTVASDNNRNLNFFLDYLEEWNTERKQLTLTCSRRQVYDRL